MVRRGKVVARGYLVKGMGSPFGDTDCLDICNEMSEGGMEGRGLTNENWVGLCHTLRS